MTSPVYERTFLTTDVEGSTALHRRHPDDMLAAMDLHDEILYSTVREFGGDPFKNTGDGIFAVFAQPLDAVQAAIETQRRMRAAEWGPTGRLRIRTGIHVGTARRRGSDYFGPALPTVNRLEGAASADQILISDEVVRQTPAGALGRQFSIKDLGEFHFKGIDPLRVFQLEAPDLPSEFGALGGKREATGGNLPASVSSFLGREKELEQLSKIAKASRVLTLLGPGGIGKTRLGLELVRSLAAEFPDGAWLVELSELERGATIWPTIADTLGLPRLASVDPRAQTFDRLRGARAVLLIDNCEHVIKEVADAATELSATCGSLSLIATSRHILEVYGEAIYQVPALAAGDAANPGESNAVRLFVERAKAASRRFRPSEADLGLVYEICANLEQLPLAIEIAASQVRRFTLQQLKERSANPLDIGTFKGALQPDRQRTLRQTLDWSYELLDGTSRDVLRRLSVFSGSIREELGISVCVEGGVSEDEVLEAIDELIDASLLEPDARDGRRYRMLFAVRAFGREKLAGELRQIERVHGEVFAERCVYLSDLFASDKESEAVAAFSDETPNLRAAFERALKSDLELAARLAVPLFLYNYFHRGGEFSDWGLRIMDREDSGELHSAPILLASAAVHALHVGGEPEKAHRLINRALEFEAAGRASTQGWALCVAGQVAMWRGRTIKSIEHHTEAIESAKSCGNLSCQILAMTLLPYAKARFGDLDGAKEVLDSLALLEPQVTQPSLIGYGFHARANYALAKGDAATAISQLETGLEYGLMGSNLQGNERVKRQIADIRASQAEPLEAIKIYVDSLVSFPENGDTVHAWLVVRGLLTPLAASGADQHLALLSGALNGSPIRIGKRARAAIEISRARLSPEAFDQLERQGADLSLAQVRRYVVDQLSP